jgi:hypothetical protein
MKAFATQRRRGRPKAERSDTDLGTPEIQARRKQLARGVDPQFSEHPLGLMFARGLASADQHWAGCRYAMLYRLSVGRTQVTYNRLYDALSGGSGEARAIDADSLIEARERFLSAKRHLLSAGRAVAAAVENLAVFNLWPDFLTDVMAANDNVKPAVRNELSLVCCGLDALLHGFRNTSSHSRSMEDKP